MTTAFDFVDSAGQSDLAGVFVLDVPEGLQTKGLLLEALANAGHFPDYFGNNWDALLDCLQDFSWVQQDEILIWHCDLPLQSDPVNCRTYLEILAEAVGDCARTAPTSTNAGPAFVRHELRVVFPLSKRSAVLALLR